MSMMVSFVLSFFPRDVLDDILNLIESVSEDFPSYSYSLFFRALCAFRWAAADGLINGVHFSALAIAERVGR